MKQLILLSLIGISLTGCIFAPPYDGNHRHHHDRGDSDRRHYDRTTIIEQPTYQQRRPW